MIEPDLMPAFPKRRWLTLALVFALTAVASFQAFDPDFGAHQHLSFAILPYLGSLALLPSDPGTRFTPQVRPAFKLEALAPAVPPRAPPV
jgi:hypothetical protein